MGVVLKYRPGGEIPAEHKFLHAAILFDELYIWLEVDPASKEFMESPYVVIVTGYVAVPEGAVHKATAINYRTGFVAHVYDIRG